jgi:aryl sulfotransferase
MDMKTTQRVLRTWHMDSRRWAGYRPRAGDVIVGTYPKCGTTWTQQIVSLLIFQSPEPRAVMATAPWIDFRAGQPAETALAMIEAQDHRRSLKTHLPLDALPFHDEVRYIHVARDGLDAFMSWHNHTRGYKRMHVLDAAGEGDETIGRAYPRPAADPREFFRDWMGQNPANETDVSARSFFDTERTWWAARDKPNMLMVHYTDLKADLDGQMRRIADFLGIETPKSLWPQLVEAATFEAMRREGKSLMPTADTAFEGGHEGFLFQGRNQRWRDVLTEEDITLYRTTATRELPPDLNTWLAVRPG